MGMRRSTFEPRETGGPSVAFLSAVSSRNGTPAATESSSAYLRRVVDAELEVFSCNALISSTV
jgi:hypothetical protein